MPKEVFVQIGVTSLRSPTGEFLPAVPLYIKTTQSINESGLTQAEENLMHDVAVAFADEHDRRTSVSKEV